MPVGTFEYRDEAEKAAIGQHIAFAHRMRELGVKAPHGQVLDRLEGRAADAGRDLLRGTLERAVRATAETREGKKGRIGRARAGAGGTAKGGVSGT